MIVTIIFRCPNCGALWPFKWLVPQQPEPFVPTMCGGGGPYYNPGNVHEPTVLEVVTVLPPPGPGWKVVPA